MEWAQKFFYKPEQNSWREGILFLYVAGMRSLNDGPAKLRKRRLDMGLSQNDLACQLGFREGSSIHLYESRSRPLVYCRMLVAARVLGIPAWELAWPDQRKEMIQLAKAVAAADQARGAS